MVVKGSPWQLLSTLYLFSHMERFNIWTKLWTNHLCTKFNSSNLSEPHPASPKHTIEHGHSCSSFKPIIVWKERERERERFINFFNIENVLNFHRYGWIYIEVLMNIRCCHLQTTFWTNQDTDPTSPNLTWPLPTSHSDTISSFMIYYTNLYISLYCFISLILTILLYIYVEHCAANLSWEARVEISKAELLFSSAIVTISFSFFIFM